MAENATRVRRQHAPVRKNRSGGARRSTSLIDWREPAHNTHVLDWRERAHRFGLVPLEESQPLDDLAEAVHERPEQLLEEEEPESAAQQILDLHGEDEPAAESSDAEVEVEEELAGEQTTGQMSREDVDLVRLYLNTIGRRKLLTAQQEKDIARRIEEARADLLAALGAIPSALDSILSLTDQVRHGQAPAAELILLPDGGELRPERVQPVLRALGRVRRGGLSLAQWRDEIRSAKPKARETLAGQIEHADALIARTLRPLPIRPALIAEVHAALVELDRDVRDVERQPRGKARDEARHALEERIGLPFAAFRRRFDRITAADQAIVAASATCSKRTSGSSCRSPAATSTAGCRCLT